MTAPTPNAPAGELTTADEKGFVEWFARNYPGPTVISDPHWHAPKIYREAIQGHSAALLAARRDADALAEWNAMLDEAAPQDVKAFADKTNGDLAETLRWMRRYVPTGFHALLNATIDRLLAARREVEALLRVAAAAQACLVLGGSLPNGVVDAIHEMRAAGVDALTLWNAAKNAAALAATPRSPND